MIAGTEVCNSVQAASCHYSGDVVLSMSSVLCRILYFSTFPRIHNVMTPHYLSRCCSQHAGLCTLRTVAGSSAATKTSFFARPSYRFASSAQQEFCRGLSTRHTLRSGTAVQAESEDIRKIETADLASPSAGPKASEDESQQPQQPFPGVQADAGVEVVSEAIPTEAVLTPSVVENNVPAVQSSSSPANSGDWESAFQPFLDVVKQGNYFEGKAPSASNFSISTLKRGMLNFARARQDILFTLPAAKVQAVLAAGPPYKERKLATATKRLSTTFGDEVGFLGQHEGSFQDLTRYIIAAAYSYSMHKGRVQAVKDTDLVDWNTHQYNEALTKAMTDLLPDIVAAAAREPEPESQAKAAASALVREQKAVTPMQTDFRPSNANRGAPTGDRRQDRSRFFMEKGWDGFTDPKSNVKPGDWTCTACNQHNFARNQDCFKCGAPKGEVAVPAQADGEGRAPGRFPDRASQGNRLPQGDGFGGDEAMPEGDWDCSECGTSNFARRGKCFKCGRPRSKGMIEGQRPGDWTCPSCSANNFSRRTECFRCSQPKPEDQGYRAQSRRDNFAGSRDCSSGFDSRPVYEPKPGDWDCTACGASNFARRGVCFKCGEPKSGGGSGVTTSGRSAGRVFDSKQDESSWFNAEAGNSPSTSSSSGTWDPRNSLGSSQPQPGGWDEPRSADRSTSRRGGRSSGGSDWDRGGAARGGRGGASNRGYSSSSRGGGSSSDRSRSSRGSADSRDGGSFSGYSRGRDIVTGQPIKNSKSRNFSEDSFGGDVEW